MSSLRLGRLLFAPPQKWYEQVGDPVTNLGGAVVPQPRLALRHAISAMTLAADGQSDTLAARLVIRRQLRSLLNNTPMKLQGYLYVMYSDDIDQNGWYVPDQGQFQDGDGSSGLATGWWVLDNVNWMPIGHIRTHREGRDIWMKDLRTGLYPRDTLRFIYSTDFSSLTALQLSVFPNGATSLMNTVTTQRPLTINLPTCRDTGVCLQVQNLSDLSTLSYDRLETAMNLSDVIAYDRQGANDAPSTGPGPTWIEAYGADFAWNWAGATPTLSDAPVLDNGLIRIRYDSTNIDGFRVDVWTGAAYVEQGKITFLRQGAGSNYCDTFISAGLFTDQGYTPDRAVLEVVLAASADVSSRERIFITLQRGEMGFMVEVYPSPKAGAAGNADCSIVWTPVTGDANQSVIKLDNQSTPPTIGSGKAVSSAGTASTQIPTAANVGSATFATSENYVSILRCSAVATIQPYQVTMVVLQAAVTLATFNADTSAYGSGSGAFAVTSTSQLGYEQTQIFFSTTTTQQILEAESITLGTNTTNTTDANASNGHAATATRTTDANAHVSQATFLTAQQGTYRVVVRAKVSANTGSIYVKAVGSAVTNTTVTTTSTSYIELDLGEYNATGSSGTMEIHAWMSGGAGTISIDRIESYLVKDQTRTSAIFSGSRDLGQAALYDSRQTGAVVSR